MPRNAMGKIVKRELAQMLKQKLDAARGGGPSA
jgi:acyl-coenzyme A synthetase/AMP-(fatty) acid ligase